ncbi:NS5 protein [Mouse coronavirus]|nr:NS5 protein [Mouse coronavirus]
MVWMVGNSRLRYTRRFGVTVLEDLCFKHNYQQPFVGYCFVPPKVWCRSQGRVAAQFTLKSTDTSIKNHFGIVTCFTAFNQTVQGAVEAVVQEAIEYITQRYG